MEGPSVRAIADRLKSFQKKKVLVVSGNTKEDKDRTRGETTDRIFSRGKNLFLQFPDFSIKVHFLMYGSYRINAEREGKPPRLSLAFEHGVINFYNCSVKIVSHEDMDEIYPEELDITSEKWNLRTVLSLAAKERDALVCDVLLDQGIFLGVGNIIKNEALFMGRIHPLSVMRQLGDEHIERTALKARDFSRLFYEAKLRDERLNPHLLIYRKRRCPSCEGKVTEKRTGERRRITFFCPSCQALFA